MAVTEGRPDPARHNWGPLAMVSACMIWLCLAYILLICYISMKNFPRWRNLKHFNDVATVDFSDGQAFVDIMKVCSSRCSRGIIEFVAIQGIIYCVVDLLGKNDPLLHALRQYARCRIMIGMACMTEDRLQQLEKYVQSYSDLCIVSCLHSS
jgi:hypothetical protein